MLRFFRQLPFTRTGTVILVSLILALMAGLIYFTVSQNFQKRMLSLLPSSRPSPPEQRSEPSIRLPIKDEIKLEPTPTEDKPQEPKEAPATNQTASEPPRADIFGPEQENASKLPATESFEKALSVQKPSPREGQAPENTHPLEKKIPEYSIQVGACRKKISASSLADELEEQGYQPVIFSDRHANGDIWYKVRVGHFTTQAKAKEALQTLKQSHNRNGFLISISKPPQEQGP